MLFFAIVLPTWGVHHLLDHVLEFLLGALDFFASLTVLKLLSFYLDVCFEVIKAFFVLLIVWVLLFYYLFTLLELCFMERLGKSLRLPQVNR